MKAVGSVSALNGIPYLQGTSVVSHYTLGMKKEEREKKKERKERKKKEKKKKESMDRGTESHLPYLLSMESLVRSKKLYASVAVQPASVRVPSD